MVPTHKVMCNLVCTGDPNLREIFGSSWVRACGRNIGASSRTMSNIFTMTLLNPSDLVSSSTPSASMRCTT